MSHTRFMIPFIILIIPRIVMVTSILRHSVSLTITELSNQYWFLPDKQYFWRYSKKLVQNKLYLNRANPLPWPNKCCWFVSSINQCLLNFLVCWYRCILVTLVLEPRTDRLQRPIGTAPTTVINPIHTRVCTRWIKMYMWISEISIFIWFIFL